MMQLCASSGAFFEANMASAGSSAAMLPVVGDMVYICVRQPEYQNAGLWQLLDYNWSKNPARATVYSARLKKQISVPIAALKSAAMASAGQAAASVQAAASASQAVAFPIGPRPGISAATAPYIDCWFAGPGPFQSWLDSPQMQAVAAASAAPAAPDLAVALCPGSGPLAWQPPQEAMTMDLASRESLLMDNHNYANLFQGIGKGRHLLINVWLDLPGLGGGQVQLSARPPGALPLMFFQDFADHGLTIKFRSRSISCYGEIVLEFADGFRLCPAGHIWVFCFLCQKFHFPPDMHRVSSKHRKKLEQVANYGYEATRMWWLAG